MSSMTEDAVCSQCKSDNAYQEHFDDDESGHIYGCFDCGYYDVLRENPDTEEIIEEYQGYNHEYRQDDIDEGRASE